MRILRSLIFFYIPFDDCMLHTAFVSVLSLQHLALD